MKSGDTLLSWLNHAITIVCFLVIAQTGGAIQLPRFTNTPLNVTAQKGGEAVLRCGIDHLGTKTVGWRKLPYNVPITIGKEQYLEYNRFKLVRVLHLGEWNLHIKNAQTFDSGVYECQVSSKDNPLRRNITLKVTDQPDVYIEPKTSDSSGILVSGTEFVEKGSPIKLLCNVTERNDPQRSPDWFKDGIRLQTSNDRVYIQLQATHSDKDILSWLNINQAQMSDTGIYVCRASQKLAARFKVDVLNTGTYNEKRDTKQGGALVYSRNSGMTLLYSPVTFVTLLSLLISLCMRDSFYHLHISRQFNNSGKSS